MHQTQTPSQLCTRAPDMSYLMSDSQALSHWISQDLSFLNPADLVIVLLVESLTPASSCLRNYPQRPPVLLPSAGGQLLWPDHGARETLYPLDPVSHGSAGGLAALPALIPSAVGAPRPLPTLLVSCGAGWTHRPRPPTTPVRPPPRRSAWVWRCWIRTGPRGNGAKKQDPDAHISRWSLHPLATKHPRHFLLQLRRPCYV